MDIPKTKKIINEHNNNSPTKYSSSPPNNILYLTDKIPVKTYHGETKWIQFRRGPIYKEINPSEDDPDVDEDGFKKVRGRRKNQKSSHIYYWHLNAHSLYPFDILKRDNTSKVSKPWSKFKKYTLYFCNPDYQIYQNDSFPQYAIDPNKPEELVPLIFYAKCNQVKFKPITFIAKTEDQIKESLKHLNYCVVKENLDGKLEIMDEHALKRDYLESSGSEEDMIDLN